jgi:zinc transporter ZupT
MKLATHFRFRLLCPNPVLLLPYRWLSLLNCFSGGVFLAAGLVHLLPHCQESQAKLGALVGDYPLYLVLITLGYMLVLFVERVLFDVHGSAHGHGPHTGVQGSPARLCVAGC